MSYVKQRERTKQWTRKIIRSLLRLEGKMLGEIRRQMRVHEDKKLLSDRDMKQLETMTKIYRQQKNHFESGDSRESIPDRIESISKPYIRRIVRGKEYRIVEFGAGKLSKSRFKVV